VYWASISWIGGLYTRKYALEVGNEWLMTTPDTGMTALPNDYKNAMTLEEGAPKLYQLVSDTTTPGHKWLPKIVPNGTYYINPTSKKKSKPTKKTSKPKKIKTSKPKQKKKPSKTKKPIVSPTPTPVSKLEIYSLDDAKDKCNLHQKLHTSLRQQGFEKVMCPFGVLVVAVSSYSDTLLRYGGNIVATLLDANKDGTADDSILVDFLAHNGRNNKGTSLVCGNTKAEEEKESKIQGLELTFSCQAWKAGSNKVKKTILFEEAFHMVHEMRWAKQFPKEFGLSSYTGSIVCRETARLQCVKPGWWHPENKCPAGAPFSPGNPASSPLSCKINDCCNYPDCDCVEFYRQAITLYMAWYDLPHWYSNYMPRTNADFTAMASKELLAIMADPKYHQPQRPLNGLYP